MEIDFGFEARGALSPPLEGPPSPAMSVHSPPANAQKVPESRRRALSMQNLERLSRRPMSPEGTGTGAGNGPGNAAPSMQSPRRHHRKGLSLIAAPIDHFSMPPTPVPSSSPERGLEPPTPDSTPVPPQRSFSVVPASPRPSNNSGDCADVDGFQDFLVSLAHKERKVLEAKQALKEAQAEVEEFLKQVHAISGPQPVPLRLPTMPRLLVRRTVPNLGIHALTYTPVRRDPRRRRRPSIVGASPGRSEWRIDSDDSGYVCGISDTSSFSGCSSDDSDDDSIVFDLSDHHPSLSLRFVRCLLGIVHCIISTLPTHQGLRESQHPLTIEWQPDYPSPTQTLYCFLEA